MSNEGLDALRDQLRANPPEALHRLADEHLHDLAGKLRDARHRQAADLQRAAEGALEHLPRLLRGPVRKAMGL